MAKRKKQPKVERVTGVGGVFFKARNPESLAAWYDRHLGISAREGHADFLWRERKNPRRKGRTVWSVFPADTDYLGSSTKRFMVNYRLANLERMLKQLRRGGVTVEKVEDYDYGRFAWITDPEGNRVELWEDKGE